ncbi:hypothetical protein [Actinomadura geliboluensis]|uniref:hypothetical protein n=1 Tax=Actinomadura geliboluensis TaxID=882440 RepID=UPI001486042B|nr:hypothetical protein [Actinomadura geliboluensis]
MPAPDTDPESTGLAHRLRTDRKWRRAAVAAALALVLCVAAAVTAVAAQRSGPGGISDGPLTAAPATADPVPAGRIVKKPPANCGVSKATAARLAPGSDPDAEKGGLFRQGGPGSCMWYSLDDGKAKCDFCTGDFRNERVLNVGIALAESRLQSPISEALRQMDETPGLARSSARPEIVEGLGEEATARYSAETESEGATVKFRVRPFPAEDLRGLAPYDAEHPASSTLGCRAWRGRGGRWRCRAGHRRAGAGAATRSAAVVTSSAAAMRSDHDHQYHQPSAPCSAMMFSVSAAASGFRTCRLGDWPRGSVSRTRRPRLTSSPPSSSRYSIRVFDGAAVPVSSGVILASSRTPRGPTCTVLTLPLHRPGCKHIARSARCGTGTGGGGGPRSEVPGTLSGISCA